MELKDVSKVAPYGRSFRGVMFGDQSWLVNEVGMLVPLQNLVDQRLFVRCFCGREQLNVLNNVCLQMSEDRVEGWLCSCMRQFVVTKWNREIYYRAMRHNRKCLVTAGPTTYAGWTIIPGRMDITFTGENDECCSWSPDIGLVTHVRPTKTRCCSETMFGVPMQFSVGTNPTKLTIAQYALRLRLLEAAMATDAWQLRETAVDYLLRLLPVENYSVHMDCLFLDPDALQKPGIFTVLPPGKRSNECRVVVKTTPRKAALIIREERKSASSPTRSVYGQYTVKTSGRSGFTIFYFEQVTSAVVTVDRQNTKSPTSLYFIHPRVIVADHMRMGTEMRRELQQITK